MLFKLALLRIFWLFILNVAANQQSKHGNDTDLFCANFDLKSKKERSESYGTLITDQQSRADGDRYLTNDTLDVFKQFLDENSFKGEIIFDFGMGVGNLVKMLIDLPENRQPSLIVAFEIKKNLPDILPSLIDRTNNDFIQYHSTDNLNNGPAKLLINPPQFMYLQTHHMNHEGDFRYYDYNLLISDAKRKGLSGKFIILGNPPYFLWNRIMSLTDMTSFAGLVAITSSVRMMNHNGAEVLAIHPENSFNPPAQTPSVLIAQGLNGKNVPRHVSGNSPVIRNADTINKMTTGKNSFFFEHSIVPDTVKQFPVPVNYVFAFEVIDGIFFARDFYPQMHEDYISEAYETIDMGLKCFERYAMGEYSADLSNNVIEDFLSIVSELSQTCLDETLFKKLEEHRIMYTSEQKDMLKAQASLFLEQKSLDISSISYIGMKITV